MKTAIILAGGKAVRFNRAYKELLPISEDNEVIDCSINAAKTWGADRILIVSSPEKIETHTRQFAKKKYEGLNVSFKIQYDGEMLDALLLACQDATAENVMLMADTVFTGKIQTPRYYDLAFGTFTTDTPDRYSIFDNGRIVTKPSGYRGRYNAWGVVAFSDDVARFWRSYMFNHYDAAFNSAINEFGYDVFDIGVYSDIGTFDRYREYLVTERRI